MVSADPRVSVEKHSGINILNIRDIGEQDAGEYVCQVREMVASYHRERERESQPYFLFQISIPNDILSVQHSLNVLGMYNE